MKRLFLGVLLLLTATPLYAAWNEKDVTNVVAQIKAGKDVDESGAYPQKQIVMFGAGLLYMIDIKAKLCFVGGVTNQGNPYATMLVPCKAIKEGYPLMAPIINWEK